MNTTSKGIFGSNLSALFLGGAALFACLLYFWIFVLPNHPSRPGNVQKSASLVLKGWSHFWQECWFDSAQHQDRCRIYGGGGAVLRDDVFLPENGGAAIPEDQLKIVPGNDTESVVHLLNGTTLIPQKNFEAIIKERHGGSSEGK